MLTEPIRSLLLLQLGIVERASVVSRRALPSGVLSSGGAIFISWGQHCGEQRALPLLRRCGAGGAWAELGRLWRVERLLCQRCLWLADQNPEASRAP